jgi:hypothetical protein
MNITSLGNLCYLHKLSKITIQMAFGRRNRGVAEQEFDPLQIANILPAQLGACAA